MMVENVLSSPSKEMRDWSKFQWEKGDVLISNDGGTEVIFDEWYDDMYYEVTYNKVKDEFYLDTYKKFENRCIPNK